MGKVWSKFFPQKEQRRATERQVVTAKQAATRELQRRRRSLDEAIAELKEIQNERGTKAHD
ncbi:threonine/serine exporter family protein [Marinibacterium profundimaris]|uniref:threonine/serine exporter family protein n=1 Tax=Marinibacterium profundimaris TaxID=1679460 RepID=UPI00117F77DC|nr:threonine/serine exporter family protein [Marinibacterium profundimaris]